MPNDAVKRYGPLALAGVSALCSILLYFFGFVKNGTMVPIELHLGMEMDPTGGPAVRIWANTPLPTLIRASMSDLTKKEEDGSITKDLDIFELLPSDDDTIYAGATNKFVMTLIESSEFPPLNLTMKMIPMVFRMTAELGKFETFVLWNMVFTMNNWNAFTWGLLLFGVTLLGSGVGLVVMNKKKSNESPVTPVVPPTE